jgi:hypothetical protein
MSKTFHVSSYPILEKVEWGIVKMPGLTLIGKQMYIEDSRMPEELKGRTIQALKTLAETGQGLSEGVWISLSNFMRDSQAPEDVRWRAASALGELVQERQSVPEIVRDSLIVCLQDSQASVEVRGEAAGTLQQYIQKEVLDSERLSTKLTQNLISNSQQLDLLYQIAKKGDKLSLESLKTLVQHIEMENQNENGEIIRILHTLRLRHYAYEMTQDLLIAICSLTDRACFKEDDKLCFFNSDGKLLKLECVD